MTILARRLLLVVMVATLAACAASYTNHGYAPTDEELKALRVGKDTRSTVEAAIGQPASTGMLKDSGWYYVSSRVRHYGAYSDKTVDRQLVAISFNTSGVVTNIERFTLADGKVIALDRRVTDTGIKGVNFLQQMLRNIGRADVGQVLGRQ